MKNNLLILIVGLVLGIVIATSFKGCGSGGIVEPKIEIEYVDRIVEVPVDSIVYRDTGSVKTIRVPSYVYLPSIDSETGDTVYVGTEIEASVPIMDRTFSYRDDTVSASGTLTIVIIEQKNLYSNKSNIPTEY